MYKYCIFIVVPSSCFSWFLKSFSCYNFLVFQMTYCCGTSHLIVTLTVFFNFCAFIEGILLDLLLSGWQASSSDGCFVIVTGRAATVDELVRHLRRQQVDLHLVIWLVALFIFCSVHRAMQEQHFDRPQSLQTQSCVSVTTKLIVMETETSNGNK